MRNCACLLYSFCFAIFSGSSNAQSPDWQWEKKMGSLYLDNGLSIAVSAAGDVYTTGGFQGTTDFDPGPGVYNFFVSTFGNVTNLFISKLDASGNFVWAKSIGNEQNGAIGHGIRLDHSGSIYVTGIYGDTLDLDPDSSGVYNMISNGSSAAFILKLDSTGKFIWARQLDGPDMEESYGISLDEKANVYTFGTFSGIVDFNPDSNLVFLMTASSSQDNFICKIDSGGNFIWAKQFSGNSAMEGNSIVADNDGDVYTTGWFQDTVDFDPGPGVANLISPNNQDIFISKLDSAGNFVWAKSVGGPASDHGRGISLDDSGFVYCTGEFIGTADFDPGVGIRNLISDGTSLDAFVLKLNSNGEYIWAKKMGGPDNDEGVSVAADNDGNVYTTGTFTSTADFDPDSIGSFPLYNPSPYYWDVFISKLDISGNFLWAKSLTGTSHDWSTELVIDDSGMVYFTGAFKSPALMFDSVQLINTGGGAEDIWVAKLGSDLSTGVHGEPQSGFRFNIIPNPTLAEFTIAGVHCAINSIEIFNLLGEKIYATSAVNSRPDSDREWTVDCRLFPAGIYFVKLKIENGTSVQKLIKQ
jgi:hypothetical protein